MCCCFPPSACEAVAPTLQTAVRFPPAAVAPGSHRWAGYPHLLLFQASRTRPLPRTCSPPLFRAGCPAVAVLPGSSPASSPGRTFTRNHIHVPQCLRLSGYFTYCNTRPSPEFSRTFAFFLTKPGLGSHASDGFFFTSVFKFSQPITSDSPQKCLHLLLRHFSQCPECGGDHGVPCPLPSEARPKVTGLHGFPLTRP